MEEREALRKIVEKAWAELPDGTHEDFHGVRITKTKHMIVVSPPLREWPRAGEPEQGEFNEGRRKKKHLVVYPKPEDMIHFVGALKLIGMAMATGAPAFRYPGSVGSMEVTPDNKSVKTNYIQAHYKRDAIPHARTTNPLPGAMPRRIATKYGGWKIRAIHELESITKELGLNIEWDFPGFFDELVQTHIAGGRMDPEAWFREKMFLGRKRSPRN